MAVSALSVLRLPLTADGHVPVGFVTVPLRVTMLPASGDAAAVEVTLEAPTVELELRPCDGCPEDLSFDVVGECSGETFVAGTLTCCVECRPTGVAR